MIRKAIAVIGLVAAFTATMSNLKAKADEIVRWQLAETYVIGKESHDLGCQIDSLGDIEKGKFQVLRQVKLDIHIGGWMTTQVSAAQFENTKFMDEVCNRPITW